MYFNIISSGSKGNATIVVHKNTVILIDIGITNKLLLEQLDSLNLSINDISATLITHDHTDHISGIRFVKMTNAYALEGTLPSLGNVIKPFVPFYIDDIKITAVPTSHDATNPCGYVLEVDDIKLVYITDTGKIDEEIIQYLTNPAYLIIECNHDISMLLKTNRPLELKDRILSSYGHLCNEDSAFYASRIVGDKTKEIVLAHISEEANTPDLAINAYKNVFSYFNIDINKFKITVANQHYRYIGGEYNEN
ncbi:MAG: MBL fold metallo-hydrolase [Bacilli bacterium]